MHTDLAKSLEALGFAPTVTSQSIATFNNTPLSTKSLILGPVFGHLQCLGDDAGEFLNRLTTITPHTMSDNTGSPGFLLEHNGKIRVSFELHRRNHTEFSLFCSPNEEEALYTALDMYHFGERLTLKREPIAFSLLAKNGESDLRTSVPAHACFTAWRQQDVFDLWLTTAEGVIEAFEPFSHQQEKVGGLRDFQRARIHYGIPSAPLEWNPQFTPLDVRGQVGVVQLKGCYPGQEVIERTIAIGRPARKLVQIEGRNIATGQRIRDNQETEIGVVTSVVQVDENLRFGLAVVKSKIDIGETYQVAGESTKLRGFKG